MNFLLALDSWMTFCKADMFEELIECLQQDKINQALILWNRHQSEMNVNPQVLQYILQSLPKSMSNKLLFLNACIPDYLLLINDQTEMTVIVELLAKWTLFTASSLEAEARAAWPKNGIDFAQEILDILDSNYSVDQDNLGLTSARIPLIITSLKNKPVSLMVIFLMFCAFVFCYVSDKSRISSFLDALSLKFFCQ